MEKKDKTRNRNRSHWLLSGFVPLRLSLYLLTLCLWISVPLHLFSADYPLWWIDRSVVYTNAVVTNDFAAANQGQVKWIAGKAMSELDEKLARIGGAGQSVSNMVASFTMGNNYFAVNAGQLKNTAQPFWARLVEVGYAGAYPWPTNNPAANDYAIVNIGEVKNLFSFDLVTDVAIIQPSLVTYAGDASGIIFALTNTTVSPVIWQLAPATNGGAVFSGGNFTQTGGTSVAVIPGHQAQLYAIKAQAQAYNFDTSELLVVKPGRIVVENSAGDSSTGPSNSPLNRLVLSGYTQITFQVFMDPATPENKGTEFIGWKVLDAIAEVDGDNDGISDNIDLVATNFSNDFSDGNTSGTISQRGDRIFQIHDLPGTNKGVRVVVSTGTQTAIVSTVGITPETVITIPAYTNADFELTFDTVHIELFSGQLEATAIGVEATVQAVMTGASVVDFDLITPSTLQASAPLDSETPVQISMNNQEPVLLQAGESLTTEFTSDLDGDGILDGIDENPLSDMRETVVIGGLDSGVKNVVDEKGWTIADRITLLAEAATNHGQFVEAVAKLAKELKDKGLITNKDAAALKDTAAKSDIRKK